MSGIASALNAKTATRHWTQLLHAMDLTKIFTARHAMARSGDHTVCNTSASILFLDYSKQQHVVNINVISKDLDPFFDF